MLPCEPTNRQIRAESRNAKKLHALGLMPEIVSFFSLEDDWQDSPEATMGRCHVKWHRSYCPNPDCIEKYDAPLPDEPDPSEHAFVMGASRFVEIQPNVWLLPQYIAPNNN